jgi:ABC-type transport system substrate-binding protein
LLTAAGFPDGLEVISLLPAQDNQHTDYAKGFAAQYEEIGVTMKFDTLEYGAYLEKARLALTDPEGAGWQVNMHWGNRYNDIGGYLNEYRTDGGRNYGHWGSAELDALIKAQEQISDLEARVAAVHEINQIISDQAHTPGMVLPTYMQAWNARFANFADGAEWYQGTRSVIDSWFTE